MARFAITAVHKFYCDKIQFTLTFLVNAEKIISRDSLVCTGGEAPRDGARKPFDLRQFFSILTPAEVMP